MNRSLAPPGANTYNSDSSASFVSGSAGSVAPVGTSTIWNAGYAARAEAHA